MIDGLSCSSCSRRRLAASASWRVGKLADADAVERRALAGHRHHIGGCSPWPTGAPATLSAWALSVVGHDLHEVPGPGRLALPPGAAAARRALPSASRRAGFARRRLRRRGARPTPAWPGRERRARDPRRPAAAASRAARPAPAGRPGAPACAASSAPWGRRHRPTPAPRRRRSPAPSATARRGRRARRSGTSRSARPPRP